MGQVKPVFVKRFIMNDSVEQRILFLHEQKRLLAKGTVGSAEEVQINSLSIFIALSFIYSAYYSFHFFVFLIQLIVLP